MYAAYTALLAIALVVSSPWWLMAMLVSGKYREGLGERLGKLPARLVTARDQETTVWMHAVSVGELLAATPLIQTLSRNGVRVYVSTTTRTSQQLARKRFGAENVFYFPLDFPWMINRYMAALRPRLVILLETEFWPNFLRAAQMHGVPLAVVNARISNRSYPRYRRLRALWQYFLRPITIALAQSGVDAQRLREIGVPAERIQVTGNLKYDVQAASNLQIVAALRVNLPPGAPVWVCGSTAEGEEAMLIAAHMDALCAVPNLVTVLAPRHPERFDAIAAMLPPGSLRRSRWRQFPSAIQPGAILLLDSVGELSAVYSLATVAFVGNSLVAPGGGQNPLEPAVFGVPVLAGPHMQNFASIANVLREERALIRTSRESLAKDLVYLLQHPGDAAARGARGRALVEANRGATERTLRILQEFLQPAVNTR